MARRSSLVRSGTLTIASICFLANTVFAYTAESNIWAERRRHAQRNGDESDAAVQMAGLPSGARDLAGQFPPVRQQTASPTLSENIVRDLPKTFVDGHADLFRAIPQQYGTIRKVSLPPGGGKGNVPVVVHIQDVHHNLEAQQNIGKIVESLAGGGTGRGSLIALEGAFTPIDLSVLRAFSRRDILLKVVGYLLKVHRISGPIHSALTSPQAFPPIQGIDDPAHYSANVEAVRLSLPRKEAVKSRLAEASRTLAALKKMAFSQELAAFDEKVQAYRDGRATLGGYARALAGAEAATPRSNLAVFLQALDMEGTLDFKQVEAERARLIEKLIERLSRAQIDELLRRSVAYRAGQLRYAEFYGYVKRLASENSGGRSLLETFPAMEKYIRYVLLADNVDAEKLFEEMRRGESAAYARLARTKGEQELVARDRRLFLTGKLADFALTPDEWKEFKNGERTSVRDPMIGCDLSSFKSFYKEAEVRDEKMAGNLIEAMRGRKAAVLITGGFHSRGMADALTRAGFAVVSVVPVLAKADAAEASAYLSVFSQEKTPLEQLFKGEKLYLATSPIQGLPGVGNVLGATWAAKKIWDNRNSPAKLGEFLSQNRELLAADVNAVLSELSDLAAHPTRGRTDVTFGCDGSEFWITVKGTTTRFNLTGDIVDIMRGNEPIGIERIPASPTPLNLIPKSIMGWIYAQIPDSRWAAPFKFLVGGLLGPLSETFWLTGKVTWKVILVLAKWKFFQRGANQAGLMPSLREAVKDVLKEFRARHSSVFVGAGRTLVKLTPGSDLEKTMLRTTEELTRPFRDFALPIAFTILVAPILILWSSVLPQGPPLIVVQTALKIIALVISIPLLASFDFHLRNNAPATLSSLKRFKKYQDRFLALAASAKVPDGFYDDEFLFPFPSERNPRGDKTRNWESRGWEDPEWLESFLLMSALLELRKSQEKIKMTDLKKKAEELFLEYGFIHGFPAGRFKELVNGLRKRRLIANSNPKKQFKDFEGVDGEEIHVRVSARHQAVWADDYEYIQGDLISAKVNGSGEFLRVLADYGGIVQLGRRYPIEAMYPVLQAISVMSKADKDVIVGWLNEMGLRTPLADAVLIMLDPESARKDWLKTYAPHLVGTTSYSVTPEASCLAGGLGRVEQYHLKAIQDLGGDACYVEPAYGTDKQGNAIIYEDVGPGGKFGVMDGGKNLTFKGHWLEQPFKVMIGLKLVEFRVFETVSLNGVRSYMIRDQNMEYLDKIYSYHEGEEGGGIFNSRSNFMFSTFFSQASLELIRQLEIKKKRKLANEGKGEQYRPPVIDANDGQSLLTGVWKKIFYEDPKVMENAKMTPDEIRETKEVFDGALFVGTTHTYGNRVFIYDFDKGLAFLKHIGVPDEWLWLFLKKDKDGHLWWDFTSAGLRAAQLRKGVAAVHVHEMNPNDPGIDMTAETNGDNRWYTSHYFRQALARVLKKPEVTRDEYEESTPDQVAEAKKQSKLMVSETVIDEQGISHEGIKDSLNQPIVLDRNQLVLSFSGRLVFVKTGGIRGLSEKQIRDAVINGMQVIIAGNEQENPESHAICDYLEGLARSIREEQTTRAGRAVYRGQFIFLRHMNIHEQRRILAASDLQLQDSERFTEAAGGTEANIATVGGLPCGPPFWEGIINRLAPPLNRKRAGKGGCPVPISSASPDYMAVFLWARDCLREGTLRHWQANAIRFSRALTADNTGAGYLRFENEGFANRPDMSAVRGRPCGEVGLMGVSVMSKGKEARRIKSSFYPARNKDVLVSVKVNLEGYDQVTKRKAEMPVEAVKVWLVSDYGLKIPLSYVPNSKEGTVVEYAIRLPEDLPYPFEGRIEVTSGLWINEQNLRISIGPKIGEEAEASPGLSVEDIDRIVGGITDPQDVLYLLWEMGLAFEWKGVDAAPKTGAGFAGLVDGYGEIRGPEGTGGLASLEHHTHEGDIAKHLKKYFLDDAVWERVPALAPLKSHILSLLRDVDDEPKIEDKIFKNSVVMDSLGEFRKALANRAREIRAAEKPVFTSADEYRIYWEPERDGVPAGLRVRPYQKDQKAPPFMEEIGRLTGEAGKAVAAGLFAIQPGNEPTFELTGLGADARIMVDGAEGVEGVRDFRHKKENQEFFAKAQIRRMPTQGKDQNILTFLIFNPDIPGTKFLFSVNINNDPNVHDKQWSYTKPWEDANPTISYRFTDHAPLLNPAPNLVVVHSGNKLRDDGLSLGLYPYHRRPQESESFPTFHLFEMEEIKGSSVLIDHERTKKAPFSVSYKNNTLSSPGVLSVPPGERALKLQGTVFLQKPMSEDEAREKLKVIGKINPGGSDISGQTVELNKTGDDSFEFTVTVPFSGQPGVFDATFQVRVDEEGGDKAYVTDFGSYRVKVEMDDRVRLFDDDGRRETVDEATLILARLAGADGELADLLKRVLTDLLGNVTMDGAVISSSRLADDSPQPFHWVRDGMSLAEVLFQLLQMEAMNGGETVWAAISKQFDFLARAYGVRQNAAGEYEVDGDLFAKRFSLSGQYLSGQRADGAAHVARFMTAYLEAGRIRNSPPDANHEKQALALLEKAVDVMGKDLVNPAFSAPVADMDLKQRQRFELLDPWNRTGGFHAADHLLFGYAVQELSRAIPILIAGGLDGDRLRKLEPFLGSAMTSLRLILPQYARERNGDIGPAMNAHKTLQGMTDPADSQVIGALAQGDEPLIRLTNEAVLGTYNELDDAFRGAISGPLKERFPHVVAWGRRRPDNGTEPSCPLSMIWAARFNLAMVRRMLKDNQFKLPSETHLAFLKNQGIDIGGLKAGEVVDASNPMFRVILTALFRRAEETLNFLATNAPKDGSLSSRLRIEGESVAFEGAPGHTLTNSAFIMAMLDRQRTAAAMGTPTPVVAGLPAPSAQRWGNLAVVAARAVDAIALGNLRGFSALFTAGFSEAVLKAWKTGQDLDRKWGEEEQLAAMFEIAMANRRAMNSGESARLREAVGSLLPAGARVVGENADGQWIVFHIEFHGQPMQVRVAVSDVPPFYDDPENHTLALNRVEEDGTRTILFEAPVLERGFSASDLVIGHELDEVVGGMRHKEARKAELEVAKALRSRRERLAAQEKASGDVAVSYWKVERAKTRAEADQIISDIGVREGATPSLGLDMSFVARRAIEAVGSSRTTGDVEMSLSQAVQEGKTTAVLFVDSAAAIGDWLRIRLALEDFAKAGKVLVVTPDETIADKLGKTLNVEVAISPFEDLGNGLFGLDVLALKRGSGTFAKYLESGNYTFYHSSIVRLSVGKSAGGSETEEVEALKRAVDAAKVLLSFLRVMPPAAIDWNLMNRILAAVAQAA